MAVPQIRFHEFTDEWRGYTLSSFVERIVRKNKNNETDIPLTISAQDGLIDQREFFTKVVASKDMSGYYLLKNGEFAYNKSSSVGFDYGSIKRLDKYEQGALSTLYICFALLNNGLVDSDFITQYFDSNKWNKETMMICAEGARNHGLLNVSASDFFEIRIVLPPSLAEQKKIADFLSTLDTIIANCQSEVDTWEKYKRGVVQKLFNQEVRFKADDGSKYPEWEKGKIGNYLEIRNKKQIPTDDAPLMAFVANIGVVDKGKRFDRSFLIKDSKTKKYKRTELNDFIYSSNNLDVGSIGLNTYGTAVISDVYEIFKPKANTNPSVISYAIQQPRTMSSILQFRQGCLYGQYRIYPSDFLSVEISIPTSNSEQQKIADCLSAFDEVIDKAKQKLGAYKRLKKGLFQQMFV